MPSLSFLLSLLSFPVGLLSPTRPQPCNQVISRCVSLLGFFFYTHHAAPFLSLDSGHPFRTRDEELSLLIKESDSRHSPVLVVPISKGQSSHASYFLGHLLPI